MLDDGRVTDVYAETLPLETLSDAELARTLGLDELSFSEVSRTITQSPGATIVPAKAVTTDSLENRVIADLDEERERHGVSAGLEMGTTIGEGGMAIVRLATQRSLGRSVAVKTARESARSKEETLRLLREAWVTGALEHPNIVPVYDLGLDDEGAPIIVLKRIEGVEWGEIMHSADAVRAQGGADPLEYNLQTLIRVCHAVSLAHARGIIHRDLKPSNVMIGRFGEVYLVDWGIALSLRDDPSGRLPRPTPESALAGTPAYMAPEMIGAGGSLSERTDVYLLGAILHEILTGAPPHEGSFKEIVASIFRSAPRYASSIPPELADIARRAMSPRADARFATADELRQRLEWYLRHRGALALSLTAEQRLAEIQSLIAGPADAERRDRLYRLFVEARFGFRQAMVACEDDVRARTGLRRTIEAVVGFELAHGTPEAASAVLAELEDPPADLVALVTDALQKREIATERLKRLEQLDADRDPSIGKSTRIFVACMLGLTWTITPLLVAQLESRFPQHEHWRAYAISASLAVSAAALVFWGRRLLLKSAVNRGLVASAAVFFACQLSLLLGCHLMGISETHAVVFDLLIAGSSMATFSALEDRRLWPSAIAFLGGFLGAAARPDLRWILLSGGNLVLLVCFAGEWWQRAATSKRPTES